MVNTKNALKTLWNDFLTVTEYQEIKRSNGSTGFEEVEVISEEPCMLSFSTLNEVNQTDGSAVVVQVVKIICDNALTIKPGSKITVKSQKRNNRVFEYSQSGEPGVYSHHQEIVLIPFKGWV